VRQPVHADLAEGEGPGGRRRTRAGGSDQIPRAGEPSTRTTSSSGIRRSGCDGRPRDRDQQSGASRRSGALVARGGGGRRCPQGVLAGRPPRRTSAHRRGRAVVPDRCRGGRLRDPGAGGVPASPRPARRGRTVLSPARRAGRRDGDAVPGRGARAASRPRGSRTMAQARRESTPAGRAAARGRARRGDGSGVHHRGAVREGDRDQGGRGLLRRGPCRRAAVVRVRASGEGPLDRWPSGGEDRPGRGAADRGGSRHGVENGSAPGYGHPGWGDRCAG
jgi:hypothetical protein